MNKYNLGKNLLFAGCFLLPTSGYIGPFLILLACICGSSLQGFKALLVRKMYPLYFLTILMLISVFTSPFGLESCSGIFNWLPFFWLFWSLSIYLRDKSNIKRVAMNLVYGTIPVLIIGFSKIIFGFDETLRIFGSFIVWHVVNNRVEGIGEFTGIFYNRNICAAWLAAAFPLFIAAAIRFRIFSREDMCKKIVALFALLSISLAMIMSGSRNAMGALVFGSLGMFANFHSLNQALGKLRSSSIFIKLLVTSVIVSANTFFGLMRPLLDNIFRFLADGYRLEIWRFGIHVGSENFLVGSGSGGFANYVSLLTPFDRFYHHVHSLPLDLWISYGFLASIVFLIYVFAWLFIAIRAGVFDDGPFGKAWLVSFVLLIIVHVTDLPYLDARINLVGWILFSGIVSCVESSALVSTESSRPALD